MAMGLGVKGGHYIAIGLRWKKNILLHTQSSWPAQNGTLRYVQQRKTSKGPPCPPDELPAQNNLFCSPNSWNLEQLSFSDLCSPTTFFFWLENFSKYRADIWMSVRPDIWMGQMSGHFGIVAMGSNEPSAQNKFFPPPNSWNLEQLSFYDLCSPTTFFIFLEIFLSTRRTFWPNLTWKKTFAQLFQAMSWDGRPSPRSLGPRMSELGHAKVP